MAIAVIAVLYKDNLSLGDEVDIYEMGYYNKNI